MSEFNDQQPTNKVKNTVKTANTIKNIINSQIESIVDFGSTPNLY